MFYIKPNLKNMSQGARLEYIREVRHMTKEDVAAYFGFVYPELILQEDAYLLVEEEGAEYQIPYEEAKQFFLGDEDGQEQPVRIKWRLAEYVYQVKEKIVNKKD